MFNETITSISNEISTGTASEAHALRLLFRAARHGCRMEATRTGGILITREVWTGEVLPKRHTIALEPVKPVARLSPTMRRDVEAVLAAPGGAYRVEKAERPFRDRVGYLCAGLDAIPPATAARLVDRGLLVVGEPYDSTSNGFLPERRRPVTVSLAVRLALVAQAHRTRTTEPNGYVRPADIGMDFTVGLRKPGRRSGMVYDRSSVAGCYCGGWSRPAGDRDEALRYAREHREQVTKELVDSLPRQ